MKTTLIHIKQNIQRNIFYRLGCFEHEKLQTL